MEGKESYELWRADGFPLRHNLFDEDAIVLEKTSGEVLLHSTKGKKAVKVSCGYAFMSVSWHICPAWMRLMFALSRGVPFHPDRELQKIWRNRRTGTGRVPDFHHGNVLLERV